MAWSKQHSQGSAAQSSSYLPLINRTRARCKSLRSSWPLMRLPSSYSRLLVYLICSFMEVVSDIPSHSSMKGVRFVLQTFGGDIADHCLSRLGHQAHAPHPPLIREPAAHQTSKGCIEQCKGDRWLRPFVLWRSASISNKQPMRTHWVTILSQVDKVISLTSYLNKKASMLSGLQSLKTFMFASFGSHGVIATKMLDLATWRHNVG
ncbi:hypothetical protein QBC37DRAFT_54996 [Rhypophila decipiens]|uniref:Uncharacterized protein n=1 Tax=Rhypophila decipiens TaxID=261697 RepID=A0AAN6Y4P8_9PEZI|nr:hypothetical protein QBC37DRAFT_54996 [Rhypophila decipiens]